MTSDEIKAEVAKHEWHHTITLTPEIATPGKFGPPNPEIRRLIKPEDFKEKRVLDIGMLEGLWSFEAEAAGARDIIAVDDLTWPGAKESFAAFQTARQILQSRVRFFDLPVYDMELPPIDTALFFGLYYHLESPLFALRKIHENLEKGGILLVEGEIIHEDGCYANYHYSLPYAGDPLVRWIPTPLCLLEWIGSTGFKIVDHFIAGNRHLVRARKP